MNADDTARRDLLSRHHGGRGSWQLQFADPRTDAARSIIWGDGTNGSVTVSQSFSNRVRLTVYGRIPAQQNIATGRYADSIAVTVSF